VASFLLCKQNCWENSYWHWYVWCWWWPQFLKTINWCRKLLGIATLKHVGIGNLKQVLQWVSICIKCLQGKETKTSIKMCGMDTCHPHLLVHFFHTGWLLCFSLLLLPLVDCCGYFFLPACTIGFVVFPATCLHDATFSCFTLFFNHANTTMPLSRWHSPDFLVSPNTTLQKFLFL